MERKNKMKMFLTGITIILLALPASAQLSLSAKAKAKGDAEKGADASADADGDAKKAETPKAEKKKNAGAKAKSATVAKEEPAKTDDAAAKADDVKETEATTTATEEVATEPTPPPAPAPMPEPIAEVAPMDEPDTSGTTGYDGGFFIKTNDGNFKLKINGRMKARWNFVNDELRVADPVTNESGTNHTMHSNFELPYARVILAGHAFDPRLGYVLYWDFSSNKPIYALATWTFIPKKLQIKVGLFKRPISRWYLTSSAKRGFIREPIGDIGGSLDIGVQLSNDFEKAKGLEWAVGVFNGGAYGGPMNNTGSHVSHKYTPEMAELGGDFAPVVVGRIGFNNGIKGYDDTDFAGGPFRYGVGFSASTEFNHDGNEREETHKTVHYLSLDGMIKMSGLTLSAAVTLQNQALEYFWDTDEDSSQNGLALIGSYLQGGILLKEHFEPTWRYSFIHKYDVKDDLQQEITGGLTIHFFGNHGFKLENNFTVFLDRGLEAVGTDIITTKDLLFSSQLEFNF
ncbi:MAG: hypothetical protein JXR76_13775 [Deltaproteobacteria bacterium]|nr:hypothetical protein [Deltaproteobacteria bacterium]